MGPTLATRVTGSQSEPPFAIAQLIVLAAFVWLGIAANAGMRSAVAIR